MTWLAIAKVTVLLLLVSGALPLMRRCSAAWRHRIVVAALAAALLTPLLGVVLPAWEVLPAPVTSAPIAPPAEAVRRTASTVLSAAPRVSTAPAAERVAPLPWLRIAWLIGFGLGFAVLLLRIAAMSVATRRAGVLRDPTWQRLVAEHRAALGIRAPVQLRLRAAGTMPAVWGLRRPVVLLPEDCVRWSTERRRDVLAHELAHVARRDVLSLVLAHLACAVHWFNPLAWALERRRGIECEKACDDLALEQGVPASRYAEHLLNTALDYRARHGLAPVMAAQSQLEARIMAILDQDRNRSAGGKRVRAALVMLAALIVAPLSSLAVAPAGDVRADPAQASYSQTKSDSAAFAVHLEQLGIDSGNADALIGGLSAADVTTRAASAWALGDVRDAKVVEPLIRAGYDSDALVRQWAVRSLSAWDEPRVADLLIDRLQDVDAEVRQWAVRGLARHDDSVKTQPLLATLADTDAEVREWSARGLAGVQDQAVSSALVARVGVESDVAVTEWLVRSLGELDDERSVDALRSALSSRSADVREWAVRGLAGRIDARTVDALVVMLQDPDDEVREWGARALGTCGNERAVAPLQALGADPSEAVREWADRSLRAIDCGGRPVASRSY